MINLLREIYIRWLAFRLNRLIDLESDVKAAKFHINQCLIKQVNSRSKRQIERMERAKGLR